MTVDSKKKYRAFISYSREDDAWAKWLHSAIETYRVPSRLVGRESPRGPVPRRLMPVFRDRDELASSSDLGHSLREALEQSDSLLVVCSPHAAASRWVAEEIRSFARLGREDRVLALLVDGEPNADDPARECFPAPLRGFEGEIREPLAADVRDHGDGRDNARLKLIASMLGVGFDDLRQRDAQRRRRRWFLAFLVVFAVIAVLAWFGLQVRQEAEASRQAQYMNTIAQVQVALRSYDVGKARALLQSAPEDLREWEWQRLLYLSDTSVATLYGHSDSVRELASNARGTALISRSVDGALRRWDLETVDRSVSAQGGGQRRAWTDGRVITVLDTERGSVLIRWSASGKTGEGHSGEINAVAMSPDGNRVASVGEDGSLRIWDPVREALLVTRQVSAKPLMSVAYSSDGKRLAIAGKGGQLQLLTPSGQRKRSLSGQEGDIQALAFSADGRRLLSGDVTGLVVVWDMFKPIARLRGHQGPVNALAFRSDGEQVASAGADGTLRVWDEARGIELERLNGHDGAIHALAYLGNSSRIVSAGADGTLKIWQLAGGLGPVGAEDGKPLSPFTSRNQNRSGQQIRVQIDGSLVHLSADDGDAIATLRGHSDVITAVAVSATGRRILTASADGSIRLWNLRDGRQVLTVAEGVPTVSSLGFASDDGRVVARFDSGKSRSWPVSRAEAWEQGAAQPEAEAVFSQRLQEASGFAGQERHLDALTAIEEGLRIRPGDFEAQRLRERYAAAASRRREADRAAQRAVGEVQALKALEPFRPIIKVDERDARKPVVAITFPGRSERLTDDVLFHLRAFPGLRELRFDGTVLITDEGLRHIGQVSTLKVLVFNKSRQITDEGLRHLAGLSRLHVLDLSETTLTGVGLMHVSRLPIDELQLRSMTYHSSGFRDIDITGIAGMQSLHTLNMDESSATDANLATIAGLKNLRRLTVSRMRASDEALLRLRGLSELEFLDISPLPEKVLPE